MQDSAVEHPETAVEQEVVSSNEEAATPELAFSDAASAARWVKSLPLSNISQSYQHLLGQLHALTASHIGARDRATIAELIREPVAHLHAELARRYAGKPQPLDEREAEAADQAIALWQALWINYSVCRSRCSEGGTDFRGRRRLLQRAVCRQALDHRARLRAAPAPADCGRSCILLSACRDARLRDGRVSHVCPPPGPVVLFNVQPRLLLALPIR